MENNNKSYLTDFYNWLANSKAKESSIPNGENKFPSKYVLEASISDIKATAICNRLYNNYFIGWRESMKNASLIAKKVSRHNSLFKPRWNSGIYNKTKNVLWANIKEKFDFLSDKDKYFIYSMYGEDYLNDVFGDNVNKEKLRNSRDDNRENYMTPIKTKMELLTILYRMTTVCSKCKNVQNEDKLFIDVNSSNCNDELKNIKYIFFNDFSDSVEFGYKLPFTNTVGLWLRDILTNNLKLKTDEYLLSNTIMCKNELYDTNSLMKCFDYVDTILDYVTSKTAIIFVFGTDERLLALKRFGVSEWDQIFKYNGRFVVPVNYADQNSIKRMFDILSLGIGGFKKAKMPRIYQHESNDIYSTLKSLNVETDELSNPLPKIIETNAIDLVQPKISKVMASLELPKNVDFEKYIKTLDDGWTCINIGVRNEPYIKKNGEASKNGIDYPYVVFRKGEDKKLIYVDPKVDIFYTQNSEFMTAENKENLIKIQNVPYSKLSSYKYNKDINATCWYNVDLPISVYITDILRNKHKYNEGDDSPRIWYFDIEAEPITVKVSLEKNTVEGQLRIFTIFDSYEKTFYCAVRKEKVNRDQKIEYPEFYEETTDKKGRLVKSGPFKVVIKEFEDERDLFKYFNLLLVEKDPDIITGWSTERYDIPYMYVRGKTLNIPIRNNHNNFNIGTLHTRAGFKSVVVCDGISFMDYEILYKLMQQNKKENYKLDFICEEELGGNRKKNKVEISHNWMYENKLELYMIYNIVDVFRVYELELKLNYIKYQTEIIRICNVSYDDIYTKTKMIDGLLFNHLIKSDIVVKDKNTFVKSDNDDDSYEGAEVLRSQPGLYEEAADLDLKSLYPHIMIRYNLLKDCLVGYTDNDLPEIWLYNRDKMVYPFKLNIFENGTVRVYNVENSDQFVKFLEDKIYTMHGTIYWKPQVKRSYISDILIYLMNQRDVYKNKKNEALENKESMLYERYDVIQMAYKQLANSFYGVMGMPNYRTSDFNTAASITASGREIINIGACHVSKYLEKMIELKTLDIPYESVPVVVNSVRDLGHVANREYVIYGDTDSLFINVGAVVREFLGVSGTADEKQRLAWEIICKVSDYINDYVIHDILKRKGIDANDEFRKYNFFFKTEFVMSRALFLNIKKCYACNLILENGKKIPQDTGNDQEIQIKGLAPKKSSYARLGRDCSNDILKYILKKYDLTNRLKSNREIEDIINDYISQCKELSKTGDTRIGVPVSMSTDLKDYLSISSHIRGMMIYDVLFDHHFKTIDKGYQFKLTNINWEKIGMTQTEFLDKFSKKYHSYKWYDKLMAKNGLNLDVIVMPTDDDNLNVDYFTIDTEKVIDYCVYSRIRNIVEVLGITALTPEEKKAEAKKKDDIVL